MAFFSPRTLQILSYSFGTSSEVSSREGQRFCRSFYPGAPVPSSCGSSRTSAVSGLLRKKGRGCPSRFAVPPAWTRPPCAPASTASFLLSVSDSELTSPSTTTGADVGDGPGRPGTDLEGRLEHLFTGSWRAPLSGGQRSTSWRWASSRRPKRTGGTS